MDRAPDGQPATQAPQAMHLEDLPVSGLTVGMCQGQASTPVSYTHLPVQLDVAHDPVSLLQIGLGIGLAGIVSHACLLYTSRLNLDGAGNGLLSGTDNCFVYFPDTCRQCEDPACGNACPQKAITTNEQGIRVVDTDKCIGCGACHEACPWHMPTVNPETGKSSKCIACGACVAGCPSGALSIVDWDAVTSAAQAAYMDL